MITNDETINHRNVGKLSISFYPYKNLVCRAERGDLFLCHILREGQIIYDPSSAVEILDSKFQLKKSYASEINQAAEVAWLIVKFSNELGKSPLLNRRITWCVRTILIALSAEQGKPVFSAKELSLLAPEHDVLKLISQKEEITTSTAVIQQLEIFLLSFDLRDPLPDSRNIEEYADMFEMHSNSIGLKLLEVDCETQVEYA